MGLAETVGQKGKNAVDHSHQVPDAYDFAFVTYLVCLVWRWRDHAITRTTLPGGSVNKSEWGYIIMCTFDAVLSTSVNTEQVTSHLHQKRHAIKLAIPPRDVLQLHSV